MGDNLEGLVKFIYGTQDAYDSINEYDENALYFLTDTNKLYKGDTLIANYVNERVIAAALVDLNNATKTIQQIVGTVQQNVSTNITNIDDISTRLSDIGEVVQEEIEPLVDIVENISTNLQELDEVFAAVANDLNDRIIDLSTNTPGIANIEQVIFDVSTDLFDVSTGLFDVSTGLNELDYILASVGTQLNTRLTDVSRISTENAAQLTWVVIQN